MRQSSEQGPREHDLTLLLYNEDMSLNLLYLNYKMGTII